MKKLIGKLRNTSFLKSVLTLTAGTTIAQAIPALISPLLTRLYTPEDFGLLALFVSITSLFSVIVTGKYEFAIVLPKEERNARRLVRLSLLLTIYLSLFLFGVFLFFHQPILSLIKDKRISIWLYFIPVAVFLSAAFETYRYYSIRHKAYRNISESSVIRSGTASVIQIVLGFFSSGVFGLVLGNILSLFSGNMKMRKVFKDNKQKDEQNSLDFRDYKNVAGRYKDFPKFTLPSLFLNTASLQLPVFFFSTFFSGAIVGFYALTQRVLNAPMAVIGSSIGQVFFQKANEYKNDRDQLKSITWKLYKKLLQIGVVPLAVLLFFGKEIFGVIFGAEWIVAGAYAQVLSIWIFFVFISSPLSNLFFVQERQKEGLIFQIIIFSSRFMVLLVCILLKLDALETIFYFGMTGAFIFFGFIFYLLASLGINRLLVLFYTFAVMIAGILPVFLIKRFLWI